MLLHVKLLDPPKAAQLRTDEKAQAQCLIKSAGA